MEYNWNQQTEESRRTVWAVYAQQAGHDTETFCELNRSYLRAALCGAGLSAGEYETLDRCAMCDRRGVLELASILRKVYAHGVADGRAAAQADGDGAADARSIGAETH